MGREWAAHRWLRARPAAPSVTCEKGKVMERRKAGILVAMCAAVVAGAVSISANAQSPAISSGLQWLQAQVQSDGSLSNESLSLGTPLQARGETSLALSTLASAPAPLLASISSNTDPDIESLARRIEALSMSGGDTSAQVQLLLAQQNADGGFGTYTGDSSDPLDTAWALIALHAAGSTNATMLGNALTYLIQNANSDGGYGIPDGGSGSQVYISSYVLLALQSYTNNYTLTTPITTTRQWLISQQANGAYADVLTNAIAIRALAATTTDSSAFAGATAALTSAQSADGSWGDDPYLTALALEALNAANQPPVPTTGGLTGLILASGSSLPIDGAQVQASGPAMGTATTGTDGSIQLTGLVPGVYTVSVSSAGYGSETFQNVQITAGANTDLGTVTLGANSTSATLTGRITDGATGAALTGVVVSVSGADALSATTAADGTYTLANLAPGTVTITVTLANYNTVTATATLTTGTVFTFSPTLYASGTTAGSTSLTGLVEDASSKTPIAGATVTVNGTSAVSDANGAFTVDNLVTGSFTASVMAAGYGTASIAGTLAPGANNAGTILLTQGSGSSVSTVSGTVTDDQSEAPIAGATVQIQGTSLTAVTGTDGTYTIGNVSSTQFSVLISAPGYISQTGNISLAAPANVTANAALTLNAASGITIKSVTLAQPNYNPFTEAEIASEIDNSTASDKQMLLSAQVIDTLGNVVANIPAVQLTLGQAASDAAKTVPASGSLDQDFTFYVRSTPAGTYRVVVQATDLNGNVLAQNGSTVVVNPLAQIGGGITLNPPLSQIGSNQPISIAANVSNMGNLPLSAGQLQLNVTLDDVASGSGSPATPSVSNYFAGLPLAGPVGAGRDSEGNLYVADQGHCDVVKIAPDKTATVFAKLNCWFGSGYNIYYSYVEDTHVDSSGNVWVLFTHYNIVEIKPDGTVSQPMFTGLGDQYYFDMDSAGNFYITAMAGSNHVLAKWRPGAQAEILEQNGLSSPTDIARDSSGNSYVTNYGDNTVSKISPTGVITTFVSGLNRPDGIESDSAGNLYVANSGANNIIKITPDGTTSVFASGLSNPYAIRFDSTLNEMLVTNTGNNSISAVSMTGAVSPFAISVANTPQCIRYDSAGDLFIANAGSNTLTEIDAQGHTRILSTALNAPRDIAIDSANHVYVANYGAGSISEVTDGATTTFKSGLHGPDGMTFDGSGNLYVTEYNANEISKLGMDGSVSSVTPSLISAPQPMLLANDGSLLVGNNGFISDVPLAGGGRIIASNVGSVVGLLQTSDGTVYYTNNYGLYKLDAAANSTKIVSLPYTASAPVVDSSGNFYVGDYNNHKILKVDSSGAITTFATVPGTPTSMIRDAAGNIYVIVSTKYIYKIALDGSAALFTTQPGALSHLAFAGDGEILVTAYTSGTVLRIAADGTATTVLSGLVNPTGIATLADGQLAVTEVNQNRLRIFTPQGAQTSSVYGFAGPKDIVWDGQRLVFNDARNNIYTLVPGQYPQLLVTYTSAHYMTYHNGYVYYTAYPWGVWRIDSTGHTSQFYSVPGAGNPTGLAFAPDGSLTLALDGNNEILELTGANQVKSEYWGFYQPEGLAIDASGNVFLANSGKRNILKISPHGNQANIYSWMWYEESLAFDSSGQLYATGNQYVYGTEGVYKVGLYGNVQRIYSVPGNSVLKGLLFSGSSLYAVDNSYQMVRTAASAGALQPFAAGIAGPRGVRVAADGSLYVVDNPSGAVLHYANGGLGLVVSGLGSPNSLALDTSGNLYEGGTGGGLFRITSDGAVTNLNVDSVLWGDNVQAITFDADGNPLLTVPNRSLVEKVTLPQPVTVPPTGTVVYSTMVPASALATGSDDSEVSFGSWIPQFGGDYTFTITSATPGVAGKLVNTLHVGPNAHGALTADTGTAKPGDQSVALHLSVQGADFSSIAKVSPSNLTAAVPTGAYPHGMAEDPAGNVDFISGGYLRQASPTGVISTLYKGVADLRGQLPIDSAGNMYAPAQAAWYGPHPILKISPSGVATTLATLGAEALSMAMTDDHNIYVLTYNGSTGDVLRISIDGTVDTVYTGISSPMALTEDGEGTVYVLEGDFYADYGHILKITSDGQASMLVNSPTSFEFEGNNIAGDCANDLFVTPRYDATIGQSGEEHVLGEIVGNTGQIGAVFNGYAMKYWMGDMDYIVYDRFHSDLLIWTDDSGGRIYSLPVTCGAIDTEAHVVVPAGQTLTGFDVPPLATMTNSDGSTEYVWDLKNVEASGQAINFDTVLDGLKLGETRSTVESAFLVFKNTFVPGEVKVPLTVPAVQVGPLVNLTAATDASSYAPNSPVAITVGLDNTYATQADGTLKLQIEDASDDDVADLQQQVESIAANSAQTVTANWNTGDTLIGAYKVHAELIASDGTLLAKADAPFGINTGSTTTTGYVTAGVTVDKISYAPTDTVNIDSRLTNVTANALANTLSVVTTLENPDGSVRWTNTASLAQLVPGALRDLTYGVPLADAPAGTYAVTLAVSSGGTTMATNQTSFTVESSADTGAGLTGALTASPSDVPLTENLMLTGSVTNAGNAAIPNLTATLSILDPITQQIVFSSPTTIGTLSEGQSSQMVINWTAAGTINRSYVAILSTVVGGKTLTLAHQTFKLLPPPIKLDVTQEVASGERVLVLITCDRGAQDDDGEHSGSAHATHGQGPDANPGHSQGPNDCVAARTAALTTLLNGLNVQYQLMTTVPDFVQAFRSGEYNTYWVLGGVDKFRDDVADELREAVFRGDALLIDSGLHGEQNHELYDVAGVDYRGQLPPATTAATLIGPDFTAGALPIAGRAFRLSLDTGTVEATFPSTGCDDDHEEVMHTGHGGSHDPCNITTPAIVSSAYGQGHTLIFGFDLVASLMQAQGADWHTLLQSALTYLAPAPEATTLPWGYVPVLSTVQNQGEAVTLKVTDTLPAGAKALYSNPIATIGTADPVQLTWTDPLAVNATLPFLAGFSAPGQPGDYALTTQASTSTGGPFTVYGTYSYPLTVTDPQTVENTLLADLAALPVTSHEDHERLEHVTKAVEDAADDVAHQHLDDAIDDLTDAAETLAGIKTVDVTSARLALDQYLESVELMWYGTGQTFDTPHHGDATNQPSHPQH